MCCNNDKTDNHKKKVVLLHFNYLLSLSSKKSNDRCHWLIQYLSLYILQKSMIRTH